jgi:HrpA-like RNA helicase
MIKILRLATSYWSRDISTHSAQAFLSQAVDPPSVATMDRALTTLEELGAIDNTGTLTALGKHIVSLVEYFIRLRSRLLIYSTVNASFGHQTCQGNHS